MQQESWKLWVIRDSKKVKLVYDETRNYLYLWLHYMLSHETEFIVINMATKEYNIIRTQALLSRDINASYLVNMREGVHLIKGRK